MKNHAPTATARTPHRNASFAWLSRRTPKPIRIPSPIIAARPLLRGDKSYLRALRAAEMAIWNANLKFPVTLALLLATTPAGIR